MKPIFRAVALAAPDRPSAAIDTDTATNELRAARPLSDGVVLGGPEPTDRPDLGRLLGAAREAGFTYRQVDTDGLRLASPAAALALARAGANLVLVTLHGVRPAVHDRATGRRGSFLRALGAVSALVRTPGLETAVRLVLPATDAEESAREALLALPGLGLRHLFLVPPPPYGAHAPLPAPPDALRHAVAATPASLVTVGWGVTLLRGSERERPPFALARDGDPYVFRRSLTGGSGLLLVHTPRHHDPEDHTRFPPLGLARLAAVLRDHGYRVRVIDLDALAHGHESLATALEDTTLRAAVRRGEGLPPVVADALAALLPAELLAGHAVVGLDLVDLFEDFQLEVAVSVARWLRTAHPGALHAVGGDSVEVAKLAALPSPLRALFDLLVDGQGELALLGLANRLEFGDRPATALVNQVVGAVDLGERTTRDVYHLPFVDLRRARFPLPDFSDADRTLYESGPRPTLAAYLRTVGHAADDVRLATLPFQIVSGCNAHCVFCNNQRRVEILPPEVAARGLHETRLRTGIRAFYGLDATLNVSRTFLERFADELLRLGSDVVWCDSARAEDIDAGLATKLRAAGCAMLTFGIDTGAERVLRAMQKGFTLAEAEAVLAATSAAGIVNRFNLIVGFPHERDEDVDETIAFVRRNASHLHVLGCYNPFYLSPHVPLEERGVAIRRLGFEETLAGARTEAYDEVGGRPWPEKRAAVERDVRRVIQAIGETAICPHDVAEHDMLLLRALGVPFAVVRGYLAHLAALPGARAPAGRD